MSERHAARDKLIAELRRSGTGHTGMVAVALVDAYARELAERIRSHPDARKYGRGKWAADVIDPEATR